MREFKRKWSVASDLKWPVYSPFSQNEIEHEKAEKQTAYTQFRAIPEKIGMFVPLHPQLVANIAQPKQRPSKRVFKTFSHKSESESVRLETSKMRLASRKPKQLSNMP